MTPWLTVIGIGDDGLDGLCAAARTLITTADVLVGGDRHQAMVATTTAERITWKAGVGSVVEAIAARRGQHVVVLTTGDPMWFGAGANLARRFAADEMTILPHPGAFSLAAARLGWSLADIATLSAHSRPLPLLNRSLYPGGRLLLLSRDGQTPAAVADLLTRRGFGPSRIIALEHLGGPKERRIEATAETWDSQPIADLNVLGIHCFAGPQPQLLPLVPGLPDDVFTHDGKMTKRELRAAAIAALAPLPGQVLWDVGAGAGSIAIEWLRALPCHRLADGREATAFAIEAAADRCQAIARNAMQLGAPQLHIVHGDAPAALADLPQPDSVFLGGGLSQPQLIETAWAALPAGGRLVAHAVTLEGIARLFDFYHQHGGDLLRLAVSRAAPVGRLTAFRPAMEVTQLTTLKP
ncbi:precorrin-6y C5,15-methyltransferase (decarboxylating) subunit CbiE [Defluviicoccus vanus]|uniref:Precorrin-6y C5,15-methyltransferase (Decarboxylating) subunit CbiE n=1 Tax=Defluviicoccus vanus TaxID=111831 RepID=A0A7H1MZ66_9PROT|nr:precorrin-6y C5,15-methyltransferase (decarboxylating) subunit CbiE [Defluviicoccus vanus]QNT68752.1 precorrin-6y C5,15-methyltransferase (decarboxylating) subunit CbiE [Defluviicoccus vanus]